MLEIKLPLKVNGNVVIGNYCMFSVSLVNELTFKNKIALDCFVNLRFLCC